MYHVERALSVSARQSSTYTTTKVDTSFGLKANHATACNISRPSYADFSSAGAAAAVPIASLTQWSIDFSTDKVDATAFGDTNKQYLAGLPDSSGTFSGFYDDAERSAYAAAIDNTANNARRFYLYPDTNSTTKYWFGLGLFDA